MSILLLVIFVSFPYLIWSASEKIVDEKEAQLFLKDVDKKLGEKSNILTLVSWNFNTDINDQNEKKVVSILFNIQ